MKDWLSRKVRLVKSTLDQERDVSRASVELRRADAGIYVGTAESSGPGLEVFRAGAQAAAQAVQQAAETKDASVEVQSLELVKAVGTTLVIVQVATRLEGKT